jgi:hypothetical protein
MMMAWGWEGKYVCLPIDTLALLFLPAGDVGSYFGILIIKVLGLTRENYSMLPFTVVIKSLSKLVIILLIYILVPDASPSDPLLSDEDGEDGRGGRSKSKSGASVEMAQMDPTSTIV